MKRIILTLLFVFIFSNISYAAKKVDYNNPNASKEVNTLRKFRDFHLKKYVLGRAFIRYYYKYGPIAAKAIEVDQENKKKGWRIRSLVRLCLLPLMYAGKNFNGVLLFLKVCALLLGTYFIRYVFLIRVKTPRENKRVTLIYTSRDK